jgi:gliding motility-associated-like protein
MKDCFYKVVLCFFISVSFLHNAQAQLAPNVHFNATTCGQNNGSAQAYPTGGAGYTYNWSIAGIPPTVDTVSGLIAGNYSVTVYSGAFSAVDSFTIGASAGPATLVSVTQPTCGFNNGVINCSTTFASNFQTTFLRNGTVVEQGTQTQFSNLSPGTYIFIVSSPGAPCPTDTLPPIVLSDTGTYPVISGVQITPEKCFGNKKGAINVTVTNCAGGCTFSWANIPGNTTDSAVGISAGIDTFRVSGGGCINIDTIITVPGPLAPLGCSLNTHTSSCSQNNGSAVALVSGGTAPFTYLWSAGAHSGDSATNLAGNSTIYLTVTDSHGCVLPDSAVVSATPGPVMAVTPPDSICARDNTGLITVTPVSGAGPFSYIWSNAETTNVNAGLSPGLYTLTVTDALGCDTVLGVTVPAYIGRVSGLTGYTVYLGQTVDIQLQVNVPVTNVQWSPYISGSSGSLNVTFQPQQDSVYTVIITYGNGCKLYDTIQVNVATANNQDWKIPNTFTPNGDGINDYFKLINTPYLSSFHIWIFDRWGGKVFESTQSDFLWDGTNQFDGEKPFNNGVFSYVIEYQTLDTGAKGNIGGNITLIK